MEVLSCVRDGAPRRGPRVLSFLVMQLVQQAHTGLDRCLVCGSCCLTVRVDPHSNNLYPVFILYVFVVTRLGEVFEFLSFFCFSALFLWRWCCCGSRRVVHKVVGVDL